MGEAVIVKGAPTGRPVDPPSGRGGYYSALADRPSLIILEAGLEGAPDDRLGLLGVLEASGPTIVRTWIVGPDDLEPEERHALEEGVAGARVETSRGTAPPELLELSTFLEPERGPFAKLGYSAAGFIVARDLLRLLGLLAEHVQPRRGGGSTVWPWGWGVPGAKGSWRRRLPDRPCVVVEGSRVGARAEWGPVERGRGKRRADLAKGGFVDVARLAYSADALRTGVVEEHLRAFGLPDEPLPRRVRHDAAGVRAVLEGALRVHELAVVVDLAAGEVLVDDEELAEGRRRIDLARTASPATIAAQVPARLGIRPPASKLHGLTPDVEAAFEASSYGGVNVANPEAAGAPFPCVAADRASAFAADAVAVGLPEALVAEVLEVEDVDPAELLEACRRSAEDPASAEEPETMRPWGLTVTELRQTGRLRLPVRRAVPGRPDGDLDVVRVDTGGRVLPWRALDLLAAAVLDGEVPAPEEVVRVVRLVPRGRQEGLRPALPLIAGLVVTPDGFLAEIARHRQLVAKPTGDRRLAGFERLLLVALSYGLFGRRDLHVRGNGRRRRVEERPGPYYNPALAGAVTAAARLRQAVLTRRVADLGGIVAYSATDSGVIPACPGGGLLERRDGSVLPLADAAKVEALLAEAAEPFGSGIPGWAVTRDPAGRQLHALVLGEMRHAIYVLDNDGRPELLDASAAGLGGTYASPPGVEDWSVGAVWRLVDHAVRLEHDPRAWPEALPWPEDWPALRPRQVLDAATLRSLPPSIGARLGSHVLEGQVDPLVGAGGRQPIALDPGGDLSGWRTLAWVDRRTGAPLEVTTSLEEAVTGGFVALEALAGPVHRFGRRMPPAPDLVVVDRVLLGGGSSAALDAAERGDDPAAATVAYGAACARVGCAGRVTRRGARYCSTRCAHAAREAARRRRTGAHRAAPTCQGCGATLPAGSRLGRRWCSDACRMRAARGGAGRGS